MTWLAEWLKQIIFVVLLATFIDLLLPNRSMERYVKLVVSLLILLTLISPVMRLFAPDAQRQLETALMDSTGEGAVGAVGTDEILRQGEQMRMKREREAIEMASEEAAKRIKEQIERETGQRVERVVVGLEPPENGVEPLISAVEVYITQERGQEEQEEQELSSEENTPNKGRSEELEQISIAPVEPIRIKVEPPGNQDTDEVAGESVPAMAITGRVSPTGERSVSTNNNAQTYGLTEQIADILTRNWGIPRELVRVVIEEIN
ncbi:stage III sporulation protein AF [Paenibacillus bouchesdurhonensis]|uniref:stage III sporulation protein AF n=1 Tax=Paenibacillus bouchesdurhonensis TaxID=1870990 RepID=UPI000DA63D02|nr:stage III sporulation protein AF [Paenibacillus bouchesdurhonensis]